MAKRFSFPAILFLLLILSSSYVYSEHLINPEGKTVRERFGVPEGFVRTVEVDNSFGLYLRTLPLKPHGSLVHYHDGKTKENRDIYIGVVDMDIGIKNLQQCADAVIRLRGEYLFDCGASHKIHFNLTNGFRMDYKKWMEGYRLKVSGNMTWWILAASPDESYDSFMKYMDVIFMYAGTLSLSNELQCVNIEEMRVGDVFIRGGSPGHAVIVVDMAMNRLTGKKIFMLAQSYMPAQETQILINRMDPAISPWYDLDFGNSLDTPEWTFYKTDLKRFP